MTRLALLKCALALLAVAFGSGRADAQYPTVGGSCNGGSPYGYSPAPFRVSGEFSYQPRAFPPPSVYASPEYAGGNGYSYPAMGGYSSPYASPYASPYSAPEVRTLSLPYEYERRYGLRGNLRFERYQGQELQGGGRVICGPDGRCYVVR